MNYTAVTIKDIAKALGVSTSTVSRALRDSYEINPETKKAILECARQMNYRPNPIALSLKKQKTRSIGVVISEIANSFFSQAINGVESVANESGYHVVIAQTHESYTKEMTTLEYLASRSIDGLLVSVSTETRDMSHFARLSEKGLPIVFFDRITKDIKTHTVVVDNFRGAYEATQHLLRKGCKHIAHLANAAVLSITQERLAGYKSALKEHGMPLIPGLIKYCHHGGMLMPEVEEALTELLQHDPRPDAIFAAGDKLTTETLQLLRRRHIRVPEEIALTGFSNSELIDLITPPLTVVKQPAFEMGEIATRILIEEIERKLPASEYEQRKLNTQLIER